MTKQEQITEVLTRGTANIYPSRQVLEKALRSDKKLKLYCGYDPTASTLHIGHAVSLRKLAQFQKLGHQVIMLIGDFTGMIGDPTDKAKVRKKLTRSEVLKNAKNYQKLAGKFLRFTGAHKAELAYNSEWNAKLTFADLIELSSHFTVQQMIVRDMFQRRIKKQHPVFLHEFLYPLAQAYDSVMLDVDLEVGGNDQTFNMLCGRDLMKILKKKEKFVLAMKLLEDSSGAKMGKTTGNMVALDEKPEEIFGQIMAWTDGMIMPGLELCTDIPVDEIEKMKQDMKDGRLNPRDAKARLAKAIVGVCHSAKEAERAEKEFENVFKGKKSPADIPVCRVSADKAKLLDLIMKAKLTTSRGEAKRLIQQGAVRLDDKTIKAWDKEIAVKKGMILKVGKRRFVRLD